MTAWQRCGLATPLVVALAIGSTVTAKAQSDARAGEWPTYGGDLGNTRYAPLDQINASNFHNLKIAWRFSVDQLGPPRSSHLQATPLVVRGRMYLTAGARRSAVALDARTGALLWRHHLDEGDRAEYSPRPQSGRGVAYWTDGREERILYVTIGYQLVALNAADGTPIPGFGTDGVIDLKRDFDQVVDPETGDVGLASAPVVAKDIIIIGAAHLGAAAPASKTHEKGYVRAYDVRTGRRIWTFHTIPRPGEFGNDSWLKDSWSYTGNAGVWAQISVDEETETVYLPVELPTGDFYGGHRHGNGLFGESLVAVDLRTGRRKWHYQLVHHGLWDMDIPCAPMLVNLTVDGTRIKAVAQPTKQGWVYVFDRLTGKPVWPIEERPVEQGNVPGEWYAPTQPFVTKPPAFERQGVTVDDLIDFTPELKAEGLRIASHYKLGPIFTPPIVSRREKPYGILMLPSITGGANWPGGSFDPETQHLYIFSNSAISTLGLIPADPDESDFGWFVGTAEPVGPSGVPLGTEVQRLPLVKPPYGRITALDLSRGTLAWQVPHGETPDHVRNHPALKGRSIPRTGRPGRIGVLTTRSLVIAGEGGFFTAPTGERGAMLRAYDKATGSEVGSVYMPAPQTGSPMTYVLDGRQYLTVPISGPGFGAELLTFALAP
ncbi:MAG: PQQ-binding-like beta-propeller repeat protein [Vicinamibacterales bacterium]